MVFGIQLPRIPILSDAVDTVKSAGEIATNGLQLIKAVLRLIAEPHKLIPYLFVLIFGLLFAAILLLWHVFWSLPILNTIAFWVYYILVVLFTEIIVSIVFTALFILFACIDVCLWLLDLLTLGAVRYLTRCEDSPDAWYKRGNFALNNIVNSFFFCQYPCANRFKPLGGFMCMRNDSNEPSYCPQSQIYRLFKGESLESPVIMNKFKPDVKFWTLTIEERKEKIRAFFNKRQNYLQNCNDKLARYDNVIRNVCTNYKTVPLPDDNKENREKLRALCCQVFCDRQPQANFCGTVLSCPVDGVSGTNTDLNDKRVTEVVRDVSLRILHLALLITVLSIITMMYFQKKKGLF